ncbi:MAG: hypothetical protein ACRYHQ_05435 [Janthinobacterium lividum]
MSPQAIILAGCAVIVAAGVAGARLGNASPLATAFAAEVLCLLSCWLVAQLARHWPVLIALAIVLALALSLAIWVGIVWCGLWLTSFVPGWWLRVAFTVETFVVLTYLVLPRW